MKRQPFEQQLRHAVAPAPDMETRLRARRAALAEFARVHAQDAKAGELVQSRAQHEAPAAESSRQPEAPRRKNGSPRSGESASLPATSGRKSESFWPLGWPMKSAWLGGMATACVVVIGVSVVWLMPAHERAIQLNVPLATAERAKPKADAPAR